MNAEIKMTSNVDTLQLQVLSNLDQTNKKKKKLKRVLATFFSPLGLVARWCNNFLLV